MRYGATSVSNKHVQPLPSTFNDAHLGLRSRRNRDLPQGMSIAKRADGRIRVRLQARIMSQQVTVTKSHLPAGFECGWQQPLNESRESTIAAAMKGYERIVDMPWDEKPDWLQEAGWRMVRHRPCMSYIPRHPCTALNLASAVSLRRQVTWTRRGPMTATARMSPSTAGMAPAPPRGEER
jgi:hypothetical protein